MAEGMVVVVGSKVKEFNKSKGCHTSGDFLDGLNKKVLWMLEEACKRCKENKRSTVRPHDA